MNRNVLCGLVVVSILMGMSSESYSAGNKVTEQSAKAQGMANAFAAQADDPSALAYNPAGIAHLKGTQVQVGSAIVFVPQTAFDGITNVSSPNAVSESANSNMIAVPSLYLTHSLESSPLALGLSVNSFFPLVKRWDEGGALRETASTSIKPLNIQPTVAYRFDDYNLAVAAAADITYAKYSSESFVYNGALGGDIGALGLDSTAVGYGFTLGLLWKPIPTVSVGVSYRSEVDLEFDGDANFLGLCNSSMLPFPYSAIFPASGTTVRSSFTADYTLPDNFIFGVAWKPSEAVTLEVDVERTGWSAYKELKVNFENSAPIYSSVLSQAIAKNWEDVWAYHLGGQYSINEMVDLRAGYTFEVNPIPDASLGGDLPDSDRHYFNVGIGLHNDFATVDLAYSYIIFEDRTIDRNDNNPQIISGTFKSDAHIVSVSLTCRF